LNFIGQAQITKQTLCHGSRISDEEVRILVTKSYDCESEHEEFVAGAFLRWKKKLLKKVNF